MSRKMVLIVDWYNGRILENDEKASYEKRKL